MSHESYLWMQCSTSIARYLCGKRVKRDGQTELALEKLQFLRKLQHETMRCVHNKETPASRKLYHAKSELWTKIKNKKCAKRVFELNFKPWFSEFSMILTSKWNGIAYGASSCCVAAQTNFFRSLEVDFHVTANVRTPRVATLLTWLIMRNSNISKSNNSWTW